MQTRFTLGVNYWPRSSAMGFWRHFERDEVARDFELLAELGLDLVRVFLLWDHFQPSPNQVDRTALDHLHTVCELAGQHGLELDVTFFTGHMSGPNWAPGWLLSGARPAGSRRVVSGDVLVDAGYRNPFSDAVALSAQRHLLTSVVSELRGHRAIRIWNLGNEPDLFALPETATAGERWARELAELIRRLDPARAITCGLHAASLDQDNGLRVHEIFAHMDLAVMHAYPMYVPWSRAPLDPDVVPFSCALTQALCGKPVLMEEFGGATLAPGAGPSRRESWISSDGPRTQFMASESDFADYVERVLARLMDVGATGALLWCYADYVPGLYDRPPCDCERHERHFGLIRPDGTLKPHAEVLRGFARTKPMVTPPRRRVELDISPAEYYEAPGKHLVRLFEAFTGA